ncbi:MAG TPA: hypothetical protein DCM28_20475 [Phycisphaerales bacterium]|nr:hypothetical protein [Phycisphaerales bacterium]HCD32315.1 hypothetical protein [Phycisphaerales bacterium]
MEKHSSCSCDRCYRHADQERLHDLPRHIAQGEIGEDAECSVLEIELICQSQAWGRILEDPITLILSEAGTTPSTIHSASFN